MGKGPKKKWVKIIREDIKACILDEDKVRDRRKTGVVNLVCVG